MTTFWEVEIVRTVRGKAPERFKQGVSLFEEPHSEERAITEAERILGLDVTLEPPRTTYRAIARRRYEK